MIVTGTGDGGDILWKKGRVESKMKLRFLIEGVGSVSLAAGKERVLLIILDVC